jgi:GT2 family glycosyltransferase
VSIAIVIAAYNRLHLLRQCVEKVALNTSSATQEILIWDNGSSRETAEYLDGLADPRIQVVHNPTNIGQNAYARAFPMTISDYLIQLDDDVIDAPLNWDATLLDGFKKLPGIGYLAANIVDDGHSDASDILYRIDRHLFVPRIENGVRILDGPTGGWCSMTSREIHDRAGGYAERDRVYWLADEAYVQRIESLGLGHAILEDLKVFHANGSYYSEQYPEKISYWTAVSRKQARKTAVKRVLVRIPLVRRLNNRFGWFFEPS